MKDFSTVMINKFDSNLSAYHDRSTSFVELLFNFYQPFPRRVALT